VSERGEGGVGSHPEPGRIRIPNYFCLGTYNALRANKAGRSWESLVGYTLYDLKRHLEARFLPGMSWENYGAWHIDHIRPRASFTYTSPEDDAFKQCWALDNLQPLWAEDNIRKGHKWSG
jgi:hypothetical protein